MSEVLEARGVLVTGASSGIGRAMAIAVARAGADVAVTNPANRGGAEAVAREIEALGRKVVVQELDLADQAALDRIGPDVQAALGRLDVGSTTRVPTSLPARAPRSRPSRSSTCY
jgi:NAD(P)-dependent dehydrogenase (short-subunit alcohol dehydrogenase family)